MIRFGDTKSIPELKKLWKTCFADEDAYIDAFFDALYEDHNVLLEEEQGVLMGASFFLPGEICLEPLACSEIRYVYALAVYPRYRGRGIAKALLQRAYELYNAPLIAEPAEEGLVGGFYEPLGFAKSFYLEKTCVEVPRYDVQAAEILPFYPVQAEAYCRIRDAHFQKYGCVRWPLKHIAFAIQEHCSSGGGAYAFCRGGREDIVLYYREDQNIIITETTLTYREIMGMFLPAVVGQCDRLILKGAAKQSGNAGKAAQKRQSSLLQEQAYGWVTEQSCYLTGMSYGLSSGYGYLNLSLD